jgi:hypothetical protein
LPPGLGPADDPEGGADGTAEAIADGPEVGDMSLEGAEADIDGVDELLDGAMTEINGVGELLDGVKAGIDGIEETDDKELQAESMTATASAAIDALVTLLMIASSCTLTG